MPVRVQSLPESRSQTLAGEFTANNAGGNHLSADWAKNPKYHMTLLADRPCKVRLPLLLPARAVAGTHFVIRGWRCEAKHFAHRPDHLVFLFYFLLTLSEHR